MRVYVAGAYSDNNIIGCLTNIQKGIAVSARLLKIGYTPFCPWIDYQFHFFEPTLKVEDYYRYSMDWLEVSDCILVLPNFENSKGTLAEIKKAEEIHLPIFYSIEDLDKWANK